MKRDQDNQILFVAAQAMTHFDCLTPADRIRLLEGLALILPKAEADAARQTAFMIRKAQEHQLKFQSILRNKKDASPPSLPQVIRLNLPKKP